MFWSVFFPFLVFFYIFCLCFLLVSFLIASSLGVVLRLPQVVPFFQRVSIFRQMVDAEKGEHQSSATFPRVSAVSGGFGAGGGGGGGEAVAAVAVVVVVVVVLLLLLLLLPYDIAME